MHFESICGLKTELNYFNLRVHNLWQVKCWLEEGH